MEFKSTNMNDFIIIKQIGQGSFGKVYKVKRKSDQEIYAIKIINIQEMDNDGKDNAMNEIRILCSLHSDFIVGYKEVFVQKDGKELCIVMEYVGGGDLSAKITHCRKNRLFMDEMLIWKYLCQSLIGLKKLHASKIIHRDIKSANLFLSKDFEFVKLGDLNVAKVAKNNFAKTQIGTPYYLAPEIWKNSVYDYRCDIFSLGVVIYEMAALRLPFEASSLQELSRKICQGFFKRIPNKFSNELYSIIKEMLETNPRRRPSVDELIKHPQIREKMSQFGYLDVQENNKHYESLINTIIVPRNLKKLQENLPREKFYDIKSCNDLDALPQDNFKKISESKKDLPPIQTVKNPPLKPKFDFNKKNKEENIHVVNHNNQINEQKNHRKMKYQEYLQQIQQQKERRANSSNKRQSIHQVSRRPVWW